MIPYGWYFGTTMNLFLHFSIFTISLPILIVKRNREHYPRPFSIWILDVSKQMIGYIVLNFRFHMHEDFCVAYFEEIITDGIFLTSLWIIFHILSQKLIRVFQPNRMSRMESGNYTAKWSFISWLLQLGVWLTIWIVSKYIVYQLTGLFISHLYYVSSLILLPLRNSSFLEMLFILILIQRYSLSCPPIMFMIFINSSKLIKQKIKFISCNFISFWDKDYWLKKILIYTSNFIFIRLCNLEQKISNYYKLNFKRINIWRID